MGTRPQFTDPSDYVTPSVTGHNAAMAQAIRTEIARRDMTQRQFATLVGATEERISLVLRCIRRADPATLDRWARALGMRWHVELVVYYCEQGEPGIADGPSMGGRRPDVATMVGQSADVDGADDHGAGDGVGGGLPGIAGPEITPDSGEPPPLREACPECDGEGCTTCSGKGWRINPDLGTPGTGGTDG
jgi:hypothetical protein